MPRVSLLVLCRCSDLRSYRHGVLEFSWAPPRIFARPRHAHLNLLGWVTMALYGTFYALAREASPKLAWTTFWLNNIGIAVMFPSLAMVLKSGEQSPFTIPLAASEFILLGAMLSFAISVWSLLLKSSDERASADWLKRRPPSKAELLRRIDRREIERPSRWRRAGLSCRL